MVPLMVPLVSAVLRFEHWSVVKLPLAPAYRPDLGDGLTEACQRSPSSYDDGAADGTAGLGGTKVRALVRGEAAFSTSVSARSRRRFDRGLPTITVLLRRWCR